MSDAIVIRARCPGNAEPQQITVKRSFPKAVPTKLAAGLGKLLSESPSQTQSSSSSSVQNGIDGLWTLSSCGTAIHRALIFQQERHLEELQRSITQEADKLDHHPHMLVERLARKADTPIDESAEDINFILLVTCTTHSPPGLSLKDVKLAVKIDELALQRQRDILDTDESNPSGHATHLNSDTHLSDEHYARLVAHNMAAAEQAIKNPDSMCNTRVESSPGRKT